MTDKLESSDTQMSPDEIRLARKARVAAATNPIVSTPAVAPDIREEKLQPRANGEIKSGGSDTVWKKPSSVLPSSSIPRSIKP